MYPVYHCRFDAPEGRLTQPRIDERRLIRRGRDVVENIAVPGDRSVSEPTIMNRLRETSPMNGKPRSKTFRSRKEIFEDDRRAAAGAKSASRTRKKK